MRLKKSDEEVDLGKELWTHRMFIKEE